MRKNKMTLEWVAEKSAYRFRNGDREILLSPVEIGFIQHQMERNVWAIKIEKEVDLSEDNLIFDSTTRDEFIGLCLEELESKRKNDTLNNEPDYEGVVFDVANENGVWRY